MAKMYYENDCNLELLKGKTVTVVVMEVRGMHMSEPPRQVA